MRWLRRFRPERVDRQESLDALERARAAKREAEAMSSEARRVADSLRKMREDNHFAESIRNILLGGH